MSESSAYRAREEQLPEGYRKVPRGCATGCLTLPFRMFYHSRYLIAALFVSSMPGHVPVSRVHNTPLQTAASGITQVDSPSISLKRVDTPGLRTLVQQWFMGQATVETSWGGEQLSALGRALPIDVVPTSYRSTAGEESLPADFIAPETPLVVLTLTAFSGSDLPRTFYILPDGTVYEQ